MIDRDLPARYGFRSGERGTHGSRSILLADLRALLDANPVDATHAQYRGSLLEDNALGKATASTRRWTFKKLRELYGLDPRLPVFRSFRRLWEVDRDGRPLLAILCACARDPLLRLTVTTMLKAPLGSVVTPLDFAAAIDEAAPDRFGAASLRTIGSRVWSSWEQSGHLSGGRVRRRVRPTVTPESTAYALVLGRLGGVRGQLLFTTLWASLLESPVERLLELASIASQRGWIELQRVGTVMEVGFSGLLTPAEERELREQD